MLRDRLGRFRSSAKVKKVEAAPAAATVEPLKAPEVHFGGDYHTAQIYSLGYEFAFASRNGKEGGFTQACPFVYCKDFLHDAVWAHVNQKPWTVWGFKYTPGTNVALDDDNCCFFLRNTEFYDDAAKFHAMRKPCLEFLNEVEAKLGFEPTVIYEVPHEDSPCWLLVGDKNWQLAPPLVGFYTLFIRVGLSHTEGEKAEETIKKAQEGKIKVGNDSDYAGNLDGGYLQKAAAGLDLLFDRGLDIFHPTIKENYPPSLESAGLHDNFGPVNFTKGSPKAYMPHWYRPELGWKKK